MERSSSTGKGNHERLPFSLQLSTPLPDGHYLLSVLYFYHHDSMISRDFCVSYEAAWMTTDQWACYVTHPFSNETIFILALRRCDPSFPPLLPSISQPCLVLTRFSLPRTGSAEHQPLEIDMLSAYASWTSLICCGILAVWQQHHPPCYP